MISNDRADWKTTRYIFQPFQIMVMYSPVFILARKRLYSSPLSPPVALEVREQKGFTILYLMLFKLFRHLGNKPKPEPLRRLERSIWALVLQVAHGASVTDVLPVYMQAWAGTLDHPDVDECKTYLHDLGFAGRLLSSSPVTLLISYRRLGSRSDRSRRGRWERN